MVIAESIRKRALVNATKNLRERNSERLDSGIHRAFADLETAREAHAAQAQKAIRRARELVGNSNPQALPIPQIDQAFVEAENSMLSQETVVGVETEILQLLLDCLGHGTKWGTLKHQKCAMTLKNLLDIHRCSNDLSQADLNWLAEISSGAEYLRNQEYPPGKSTSPELWLELVWESIQEYIQQNNISPQFREILEQLHRVCSLAINFIPEDQDFRIRNSSSDLAYSFLEMKTCVHPQTPTQIVQSHRFFGTVFSPSEKTPTLPCSKIKVSIEESPSGHLKVFVDRLARNLITNLGGKKLVPATMGFCVAFAVLRRIQLAMSSNRLVPASLLSLHPVVIELVPADDGSGKLINYYEETYGFRPPKRKGDGKGDPELLEVELLHFLEMCELALR